MKNKIGLFLFTEAILFLFILLAEYEVRLLPVLPIYGKYLSILLCLLFLSVYIFKGKPFHPNNTLFFALVFASIADYLLLFTHLYIWGILFFFCVQLCFCLYLKQKVSPFLTKGILGALFFFFITRLFHLQVDFTALFAAFYFSCLLANVAAAYKHGSSIFFFAILLLLLCDIYVGISNLPTYFDMSASSVFFEFCSVSSHYIWFYYLPGMVIITYLALNAYPAKSTNSLQIMETSAPSSTKE